MTDGPTRVADAAGPKDAEQPTRDANATLATLLPFDDESDFDAARRGFVATPAA